MVKYDQITKCYFQYYGVTMMRKYTIHDFVSSFSVKPNGSMSLLLGAGASISSGILSGGQMIWDFKREIYCNENKISKSEFPDLQKENIQSKIQKYLDATGDHPTLYSPNEYSHYFEFVYPNSRDRELYIQRKVQNVKPALGYLCLGAMILENRINFVNTTNFDDLIKAGVYALDAGKSIKTISSAVENSVGFNLNDGFPTILKLHGDYLFDHLKNTTQELQKLENSVSQKFQDGLHEKGLIVVGYAGNDTSVMTALEKIVANDGLPYGVIWCKPKESELSEKAEKFMEYACANNDLSGILDIDNFDDLMYRLYLSLGKSYKEIDELWKDSEKIKPIMFGGLKKRNVFTKTNTFESKVLPGKSYVFDTTITSWKELRRHLSESKEVVAALFKGKVWAFGKRDEIQKKFLGTIKSDIQEQAFPEKWYQKDYSFVWSLYYDLIKITLLSKGLVCFGRNKYYDPKKSVEEKGNIVFEAVELHLSSIDDKVVLSVLPTFFIEKRNGKSIDRLQKQSIINRYFAKMYNDRASHLINEWTTRMKSNGRLIFEVSGFSLEFDKLVYTSGGTGRGKEWPAVQCFQCEEPQMCFSIEDSSKVAVNQLKGLVNYGPIERFGNSGSIQESIKLAILTPRQKQQDIIEHLQKLKQNSVTKLKQEKYFLPEYIGFEKIFRCDIDIPNIQDGQRFKSYNLDNVLKLDAIKFYEGLVKYVNVFAKNLAAFDVLIIYIPSCLGHLREKKDDTEYFDLHDSLKIYCASKGIVIQLIEERSAVQNWSTDLAKIMWGLSTGLYSKAVGRLWKPAVYNKHTAFIGLSYVQSVNNGERISIGCSQLFDAEGNGMRLYLRPLKNPQYIQKNPFMRNEDACRLMLSLKKLYDDSVPTYDLRRVVIHKTTFFTKEEMEGISRGLAGIDDIELLQIQEFTPWRAIRFDSDNMKIVSKFAIQRGTVIQLNKDNFLIWTHGSVQHDELAGQHLNYYKNGRGIPAPLLVRRFMGQADGATLANEIMMLTKMNWNSGDSFYKVLPVTLDFAKMLSRVAKQDVVIYDKPYDFRYFM